tara:strand:+ start:2904 stop:3986 length:1083 start_codon:yes stop_codon:yes gene_type:complete
VSQRGIPCLFMRGGTSRGPFFRLTDLPIDEEKRKKVLLAALGSPDIRQIDGLGGANMLTSKVAIINSSEKEGIDIDYLFAQVWLDKAIVDITPSCGNMLSGVGPFAIERGMVKAKKGETVIRIYNVNTGSTIESVIQTPNGQITYEGVQHIDGVPGTAAPILLKFSDVVGSKCGALFPTGETKEKIDGITVSCVDVAMPMVMMRASDLGITGYDTNNISNNSNLMNRIERIRLEAGKRMGLGDVTDKVIPKVSLLAKPRFGGTIYSCYLTPHHVHDAHAVTGAICVACSALIKKTITEKISNDNSSVSQNVQIEHPAGAFDITLELSGKGKNTQVLNAGVVRTARKIMEGEVFIPERLWP